MRNKLLLSAALIAGTLAVGNANAAKFIMLDDNTTIGIEGDIVKGDAKKLKALLAKHKDVDAILLNSLGGLVLEGFAMAETINKSNLDTYIFNYCTSSCFTLFAAGNRQYVFTNSCVGVHNASAPKGLNRNEADSVEARVNMKMVQMYNKLNVPHSIIAKMVVTSSNTMAWLTKTDLTEMSVTVMDKTTGSETGCQL